MSSDKPKTAKDRIDELFPKNRELPPYVGGTKDKSPVQLEKEREEAARKLRDQQRKMEGSSVVPPNAAMSRLGAEAKNGMTLTPSEVVEVGAQILGVDLSDLLGGGRAQAVALPRHLITYFLVCCAGCNHTQACDALGYHYRGTIRYSLKNIENLLRYGPKKDLEVQLFAGLKKLCEHFGKSLPYSAYWSREEPLARRRAAQQETVRHTVAD